MSENGGAGATPAGWYPDPAGTSSLRWWDGRSWTEHYAPAQGGQQTPAQGQAQYPQGQAQYPQGQAQYPQGQAPAQGQAHYPQGQAPAQQAPYQGGYPPAYPPQAPTLQRPPVPAGAPIYSWLIWLIAALPVLPSIALAIWHPTLNLTYSYHIDNLREVQSSGAGTGLGFLFTELLGWAAYAAIVVLAYFDSVWLRRIGVVRPFHWAWAFLTGPVYVIGRSVIVHKVARPRGLAPLWVMIAVVVVSWIIAIVWVASLISSLAGTLPPNT